LDKYLHIVLHDVPYPPDYGGVVDPFYTIRALHEYGIKLILHCFEYGRKKQPILEEFCENIHYYKRSEGHKGFSLSVPYIVSSRSNEALWKRIGKDRHPVLLQGIHSSYGLHANLLNDRKVVLRLFNVEADYYGQLAKWERSLPKKAFFHHEKRLLERYEKNIASKSTILALTSKDAETYRKKYGAKQAHHLPPFLPIEQPASLTGSGNFALYHGNLSVPENEKTAIWLLEKIFSDLEIPFVIAGKKPSERLVEMAHRYSHTCIVENPSETEMKDLLQKAQIHLLPSFTETGIKLKLINALLYGRHVIANKEMVKGTNLDEACHIADNPTLMKYTIYRLYHSPFTEQDIEERTNILNRQFNKTKQLDDLLKHLFPSAPTTSLLLS